MFQNTFDQWMAHLKAEFPNVNWNDIDSPNQQAALAIKAGLQNLFSIGSDDRLNLRKNLDAHYRNARTGNWQSQEVDKKLCSQTQ